MRTTSTFGVFSHCYCQYGELRSGFRISLLCRFFPVAGNECCRLQRLGFRAAASSLRLQSLSLETKHLDTELNRPSKRQVVFVLCGAFREEGLITT